MKIDKGIANIIERKCKYGMDMNGEKETEAYFDSVHKINRVYLLKEKLLCRIPMLIGILFFVTIGIIY